MLAIEFLTKLIAHFKDSYATWSIEEIVELSEVTGKVQDDKFLGHVYVEQHTAGGCEDSYYGWIYVPLDGKYVKCSYQC